MAHYEKSNGPFDGIIGFSQGGALTTMLASSNELDHNYKLFPNLKFVIILAGKLPS